jgi:glycyl-tRNA synthetase
MEKQMMTHPTIEQLVSLAKRRGFIFPDSEIYGGFSNTWDYGPLGVELKNNIKQLWWKMFVHERDDMYGLDAALIMNPKVWEASGHVTNFTDPLVECQKCHERFRQDMLEDPSKCPSCGGAFMPPRQFNMMFKTFVGPAEETANVAYFRPETAQGIFVDFKQILDAYSPKLPFGVAQIGKAFRNEITPGNFIFRTREFEQMEIEYFIRPDADWNAVFEEWLSQMKKWMAAVGIDDTRVSYLEVPDGERAHYSKRTIDIEFEFPFSKKELYGLAYRGDFDLSSHQKASGQKLEYFDQQAGERFVPHVIEPSLGVDRTVLAVLASCYRQQEMEKETRMYLALPFALAPFKAAVFPLLANKPELVEKARAIFHDLKKPEHFVGPIAFDDGGNIGKRYRKQDEIGTPFCITVDFQTLEDDTVTVRDRDTATQKRLAIGELAGFLRQQ